MEESKYTMEYGFKMKYLQDKKVTLKLVPEKNWNKLVSRKDNIHYGFFDGAIVEWPLPQNSRGDLTNVFKDEDELHFFEHITGKILDIKKRQDNNLWWFNEREAKIKLSIDSVFKQSGMVFDLSNPSDVLRYKIVLAQDDVAESPSVVNNKWHCKFMIIDDKYEDITKKKELDLMQAVYFAFGSISDSKDKKKDFLSIYYLNNKIFKEVSENVSEDMLSNDIKTIIDESPAKFLATMNDEDKDIKSLILRAIKKGAIQRNGIDSYSLPGDNTKWTWIEFLEWFKQAASIQDEAYMKIKQRLSMDEKVANSKKKELVND